MSSLISSLHYSLLVQQDAVTKLIQDAVEQGAKSLFILCCDDEDDDLTFFNKLLPELDIPVFGGVYPSVLLDDKVLEKGIVIAGLSVEVGLSLHIDMMHAPHNPFNFTIDLESAESLLVILDGLAHNIDYMIQQLFYQVGGSLPVMGGGAGSLGFEQKPCIFCAEGLIADAMIIVSLKRPFELAKGHGLEKLTGPFLATRTCDNRIDSLNFKPALEVYRQAISEYTDLDFTNTEFFDIARKFPFGIDRLDEEMLVRDPIAVEDSSLICVGSVPENAMLYILSGEVDQLISAVESNVAQSLTNIPGTAIVSDCLLFDCISRKLFLGTEYQRELSSIAHQFTKECRLVGALALGEIASCQSGTINFHNKTSVTGIFYKFAGEN